MGNKTIRIRAADYEIFQAIADGKKKFETRAATPRYQNVEVGDVITLVCGKEKIKKEVKKVERFGTIGALLKKYKPEEVNPFTHSAKEARDMWYGFPGYKEKIDRYGLVVWKLE